MKVSKGPRLHFVHKKSTPHAFASTGGCWRWGGVAAGRRRTHSPRVCERGGVSACVSAWQWPGVVVHTPHAFARVGGSGQGRRIHTPRIASVRGVVGGRRGHRIHPHAFESARGVGVVGVGWRSGLVHTPPCVCEREGVWATWATWDPANDASEALADTGKVESLR
jgi:hypothetical protein